MAWDVDPMVPDDDVTNEDEPDDEEAGEDDGEHAQDDGGEAADLAGEEEHADEGDPREGVHLAVPPAAHARRDRAGHLLQSAGVVVAHASREGCPSDKGCQPASSATRPSRRRRVRRSPRSPSRLPRRPR